MKRYKLGQRRTKTDAHGNSATMPDMIECENGEYIKYSEYEQLLESIGAGGVSGQGSGEKKATISDCVIDEREAFDLAYEKGDMLVMDGHYENPRKNQLFHAWLARAELAKQNADKVDAELLKFMIDEECAVKNVILCGDEHWYVSWPNLGEEQIEYYPTAKEAIQAAIDSARKEPTK